MPRIIPEPRYFSMPSAVVGGEERRKAALNCWPCSLSFTQTPETVTHSPALISAAWPTTVTRSRWPRALMRSTQKPLLALWKVTRSIEPASTSVGSAVVSAIPRDRPATGLFMPPRGAIGPCLQPLATSFSAADALPATWVEVHGRCDRHRPGQHR